MVIDNGSKLGSRTNPAIVSSGFDRYGSRQSVFSTIVMSTIVWFSIMLGY